MRRGGASSVEHNGIINIPSASSIKIGDSLPDFTGCSKKELLQLIDIPGILLNINGSGWVTSQTPAPGTPITKDMVIELYLE